MEDMIEQFGTAFLAMLITTAMLVLYRYLLSDDAFLTDMIAQYLCGICG